ncbi:hypothetical protein JCM8208_005236, partial [Rhodotorula glutinis]
MDHTAQGSPHQARTPQGPEHEPDRAQADDGAFYLPALGSAPTRPPDHDHHRLVDARPDQAHADDDDDGFRANSGDADVDALINSALAAYTAGAARTHGAEQLALVRAAVGAGEQEQGEEHGGGRHGHGRRQEHVAAQNGMSGVEGNGGGDDEQGLFLPQLPVPPPSFAHVHPAPAPAALPSPPPTSTAAAARALASSSAAAPPTSAASLPSSLSFPPPSGPLPPAPAPPPAPSSAPRRGRGPGSRARWTPAEDAHLVHLVRVVPPLTWNEIGADMGRAPTGCSMRWYKFLRERVARGEMGPGAAPTDAAGVAQAQGSGALEPSSEMVVGGSAGATVQAQAQGHGAAVGAGEGSLQVVDSS